MAKNEGYPELRTRWHSMGGAEAGLTLQDVFDWCVQNALEPHQVRVTQLHVKYESPESAEERERREQFEADQVRRKEEWERATYERLQAKFEGG